MQAIGIKPTDHTYTQLMLAFAKTRNLEKVLELHEMAKKKHKLTEPSLQRMNSILMAYCRVGEPEKAEHLLTEMRDEMGMEPDVVCHMTLIDGYYKKGEIDKCWSIYHECMVGEHPG
jgi:pentatricopeptide repeat protein